MSVIELVPVLWVFWGWVALSIVYVALGAAESRVEEAPVRSSFVGERAAQARYRELRERRFGAQALAYMVLANGAGGLLLYFAAAGKLWAVALFVVACVWLIYDHASSPFALRGLHPRLVGPLDWSYFAAGVVIWLYALACVALPRLP